MVDDVDDLQIYSLLIVFAETEIRRFQTETRLANVPSKRDCDHDSLTHATNKLDKSISLKKLVSKSIGLQVSSKGSTSEMGRYARAMVE